MAKMEERFAVYAKLVYHLYAQNSDLVQGWDQDFGPDVNPSKVLRRIGATRLGSNILPSLRTLAFFAREPEDFRALAEFLGSIQRPRLWALSVDSAGVRGFNGHECYGKALGHLLTDTPGLTRLELGNHSPITAETPTLAHIGDALPLLQEVQCCSFEVTANDIVSLGRMPLLQKLDLGHNQREVIDSYDALQAEKRTLFPSLGELGLHLPHASSVNFLNSIRPSNALHEVTLTERHEGEATDELVLAMVSPLSQFPNLRTFNLSWTNPSRVSDTRLTWQAFQPLMVCSHLESLSISQEYALGRFHDASPRSFFDINDDDVEKMAIAWPRLRTLSICRRTVLQPGPTVKSLVHLRKHCPMLEHVEFGDMNAMGGIEALLTLCSSADFDTWPKPVSAEGKVTVLVRAGQVADFDLVAQLLRKLWPNIWMPGSVNKDDAFDSESTRIASWPEVRRKLYKEDVWGKLGLDTESEDSDEVMSE